MKQMRLYVREHLRNRTVKQYHDDNRHMGIHKTYDVISQKKFWPNLYKNLYEFISSCVTCQTHSMKKIKSSLQETDILPYQFAKKGFIFVRAIPQNNVRKQIHHWFH